MKKNTYLKWIGILVCLVILVPQGFKFVSKVADAATTGTVTATSLNVRTGPGTNYARVQVNGSNVFLSKGTKVTILSEKSGWYQISFTFSGKKSEGYVLSDYLKVTNTPTPTPKPTASPTPIPSTSTSTVTVSDFKVPATVKATSLNVRKTPATTGAKLSTLTNKQKVTVLNEVFTGTQKWYRISFTANKKTQTGYVLSDYIVLTLSSSIKGQVNNSSSVKIRTSASESGKYLYNKAKKVISLANKKAITITKEVTDSKGKKWFNVSFTVSEVKYSGYILANQVLIKKTTVDLTPTPTPTATLTPTPSIKPTATITPTPTQVLTPTPTPIGYIQEVTTSTEGYVEYVTQINVYENIKDSYSVLFDSSYNPILLTAKEKVVVNNTLWVNSSPWYFVTFKKGGTNLQGYVQAEFIVLGSGGIEDSTGVDPFISVTPTPSVTLTPTPAGILNNTEFESYLTNQGFPESYKPFLRQLHQLYPTWVFDAYHTGLDWNTVITKESALGVNLITNGKSVEWKSLEKGAYNWETDSFIPFDGSTWVTPSTAALEYYMDPRNFLTEKGIYQFELLTYKNQYQNAVGVESILYNTALYNTTYSYQNAAGKNTSQTYSQTFIDAAIYSGVSPYHLATRVKQEVVTGTNTLSSSVTGVVSGLEGLYNFYNIGAYHSTAAGGAIANGLKYAKNGTTNQVLNTAYLIPWDNPYDSIVGGAYIIGSNYINRGQDTIYLQKFNVTSTSTYSHQYMANIEAPNAEAAKTYAAYSTMTSVPIVFSIPVYNNMPASAAAVPVKAYNPNNWLKTLTIDGYSLTPTFDLTKDQTYSLIVGNAVTSINVKATAVSKNATVSGTGNITLKTGNNVVNVTVTAENGDVRKYLINVVREN